MSVVRTLPGVQFAVIAPAGFAILGALWRTSQDLQRDLTITSGTDGEHSGPEDPHHLGCAYDVRSHDFLPSEKDAFVRQVLNCLGAPSPESGGYITAFFFGWLENANTPNEHYHFQLRHGLQYPPGNNAEQVQDATADG